MVYALLSIFILCVWIFVPEWYVYVPNACYVQRPEEGARSTESGNMDVCKLPHGCWESNLGPQEEQPVLLSAAPSF